MDAEITATFPLNEEIFELDKAVCPICGCPYQQASFLDTDDSELIEMKVEAYRRKIQRKQYKKACQCAGIPGIITAPGPAKLIGKGKVGIASHSRNISVSPTFPSYQE